MNRSDSIGGIRAFLNPFNPEAHPARGNKRFKELESEVDLLARHLVLFASIFLVMPPCESVFIH